ncbi:secretin N-terminal domain-containing protein [Thiobacillus sp.]|uniref:secretin N-terminal domain-containing protein n=1 Tax=Thiobacillus sp. TaxID=924 RepID=UPI0025D9FDBE|nr:secretin N-terminal domain-containing protein [Thiobacillus sp.]MBT9541314.1 tetratricopeptide repeat protein [Thiobacillus sp.]
MQHANLTLLFAALLGTAGLAGCASPGLTEGQALIGSGATEAGLARLQAGMAEEPGNLELKSYYYTQREKLASQWLTQAQQEIGQGNFAAAEASLNRVLSIHPENPRAKVLLASLEGEVANKRLLDEARTALDQNNPALAADKVQQVLTQSPGHAGAIDMQRKIQLARAQEENAPRELSASSRKTITLEFRDTPLRNVFDMISRQSGINFVFDKDVRLDTKATLFARNTTVSEAISMLLGTGQLSRKVMGPSTLLIYPDTPPKQKQYQELMVKSFYLGNADAKSTMAMLRVLIKTKDMYVDERLNQLVIRDTPEAIRLAEKIIATQDLAEPEVMLHVDVLEVKRSKLLDLGVQYPNQFTVINPSTLTSALTLENLKNISASTIAVSPAPAVNIQQDNSDVNILANPRIRVKNREKAKIHIGDKLPVITTTSTANVGISESVAYLDVGLKLDVEPSVLMRDDVQIKVNLEVSNIVKEIRSLSGTLTYQIGTRTANTVLRLKDGETQVLAGLISEEERGSSTGIPGLSDLPILGHLFATKSNETIKTEIVLLITPHILRNAEAQQAALTEFRGGTENSIGGGSGGGGGISVPVSPAIAPPARGQISAPDQMVEPPAAPDSEPEPVPALPQAQPFQP